jgi:microcystin-dependent protein
MAFNFVPAGVLLPFGGATAPAGWLLCDGSAVSRTAYAALFASLSIAWGYGDTSTTFNLPDMRGRFPRGRDGGIGRDPNASTRTASNLGGNTQDNVGSVQDNATKVNGLTASTGTIPLATTNVSLASGNTDISHSHGTHSHTYTRFDYVDAADIVSGTASGVFNPAPSTQNTSSPTISLGATNKGVTGTTNIEHTHAAPSITVAGGGAETRPINANVNYIIKV